MLHGRSEKNSENFDSAAHPIWVRVTIYDYVRRPGDLLEFISYGKEETISLFQERMSKSKMLFYAKPLDGSCGVWR